MRSFVLLIFFLSLFVFQNTYSQVVQTSDNYYNGAFNELYLRRQPSPRSEAMGRTGVTNTTGDFASFYNPALSSLNSGITFNVSYSSPYYRTYSNSFGYIDSSSFNYIGIAYTNPKIGSIGFSRDFWTLGTDIIFTDKTGNETGEERGPFTQSIYKLNYSKEIIKNLYAGLNIGFHHFESPGLKANNPITLDIGILKNFELATTNKFKHNLQLGIAAYNITNSKFTLTYPSTYIPPISGEYKDPLPVIVRAGGSYNLKLKGGGLIPNGNLIESTTILEFQSVVNEGYDKIIKFGEEVLISEIFAIRFGYFTQKLDTYNDPYGYNAKEQHQFTYGAGLNIPLDIIFGMKKPLMLKFDYVNMTPPSFINPPIVFENFNSFGLSLNWKPGF